jgi:hypothetical protein
LDKYEQVLKYIQYSQINNAFVVLGHGTKCVVFLYSKDFHSDNQFWNKSHEFKDLLGLAVVNDRIIIMAQADIGTIQAYVYDFAE